MTVKKIEKLQAELEKFYRGLAPGTRKMWVGWAQYQGARLHHIKSRLKKHLQ
jgi:hypothetical protein